MGVAVEFNIQWQAATDPPVSGAGENGRLFDEISYLVEPIERR
jgi:hypothetical protein